jgi:lysylphosphatidylglycerol synthetase-like protein (DUF2156 family)
MNSCVRKEFGKKIWKDLKGTVPMLFVGLIIVVIAIVFALLETYAPIVIIVLFVVFVLGLMGMLIWGFISWIRDSYKNAKEKCKDKTIRL